MIDRMPLRPAGCRLLLVAMLLCASVGIVSADGFSLLPEIDERGVHIGYTRARHYGLIIPDRETRIFAGAVVSHTRDIDATLHDPGLGFVLIQNLAGDRITGRFQVDLTSRLEAVYRIPDARQDPAAAVPAGFFLETDAYPLTSGDVGLRFITADQYHFPERAFAARIGGSVAFGFAGEPYATAHLTGSLRAVIPVFTPNVQVSLGARYRGYVDPGWLDGSAPSSALSYLDLRGYTGAERLAHGASVSADVTARLPFEIYVPMSAGAGAYADAGRVSGSPGGLVSGDTANGTQTHGRAVVGGLVEYRLLAPFRIGSVTLSAGVGALVPDWTLARPWLRIDYRTGLFFADPL